MSTDTREARLARRISDLYATDPQFAAAKPDPAISEAIEQPGLPLDELEWSELLSCRRRARASSDPCLHLRH